MKNKKILKKIILIAIGIYIIYTFIAQQKILNAYSNEQKRYSNQIAEEMQNKQELEQMQQNVNSPEYIENVAREKLGMYLPNEKVFIDIGK